MYGLSRRPSIEPYHAFLGFGAIWAGLGLARLVWRPPTFGSLLETFILVAVAASILYSAYDCRIRPLSKRHLWDASRQTFLAGFAFLFLAVSIVVLWRVTGRSFEESQFLVILAGTMGTSFGARNSLNAAHTEAELAQKTDLTKLLKLNQRVLRHNLRNELAVILGHVDRLERRLSNDDDTVETIRRHADSLLEASDRTQQIVRIWESDTVARLDLAAVVEDRVAALCERRPETTVTVEAPASCRVACHPRVSDAVDEALTNAVEHNTPSVSVSVAVSTDPATATATVEIADTGQGMPAAEKRLLAFPEETPLVHSTGFGLWVMYWVVQKSGGHIDVADNQPSGTVVRMTFPLAADSERSPASASGNTD